MLGPYYNAKHIILKYRSKIFWGDPLESSVECSILLYKEVSNGGTRTIRRPHDRI